MGRKTVYDTINQSINQSVDNIKKNERKMNIHVIIKFMVLFYLTEHISFRKAIHTFTLNFFAGEGRFNSIKTFIFGKQY